MVDYCLGHPMPKINAILWGFHNPKTIGTISNSKWVLVAINTAGIEITRMLSALMVNYERAIGHGEMHFHYVRVYQKKTFSLAWVKALHCSRSLRPRPHSSLHARYWDAEKALELAIKRGVCCALLSVSPIIKFGGNGERIAMARMKN